VDLKQWQRHVVAESFELVLQADRDAEVIAAEAQG
jgi:hypothetical protein